MEESADAIKEKNRTFPKSIPFILFLSLLERVSSIGSSCELKILKYYLTDTELWRANYGTTEYSLFVC